MEEKEEDEKLEEFGRFISKREPNLLGSRGKLCFLYASHTECKLFPFNIPERENFGSAGHAEMWSHP